MNTTTTMSKLIKKNNNNSNGNHTNIRIAEYCCITYTYGCIGCVQTENNVDDDEKSWFRFVAWKRNFAKILYANKKSI